MTRLPPLIRICDVDIVPGIGGFWVNDQAAVQAGAEADGFVFKGPPLTHGFERIREPSEALCCVFTLDDGTEALGDCVTVFNAGYAGRPPPLRHATLDAVRTELRRLYREQTFEGFFAAADQLDNLNLGADLSRPVAFGASQALLAAAAAVRKKPMAAVLLDEMDRNVADAARPGFAGSCGGDWRKNVDKAILRRLDMFPQSAIQTRAECESLADYVAWIRGRLATLGGDDYQPDLHFDFHSALGRMFDNDETAVIDYLARITRFAAPYRVYFEDPLVADSALEAAERMARLRERIEHAGLNARLIADEWANAPAQLDTFIHQRAAHAVQIKMPDNGSIVHAIRAVQKCRSAGVLAYLGGSCNETEVSSRVTVHLGVALGAWRMLTKPGLGFDEGLMIMTNELNRVTSRLGVMHSAPAS